MGSLHANFDKNRISVKKFVKNRVLKQTPQKDQYRFKRHALQICYLEISKCCVFDTKKNKKAIFLGNPLKNPKFFFSKFENGIYVIEPHVYHLHVNFMEIHQYLVPEYSKNLKKLRKQKFSITLFGSFRQLTKMKMISLYSQWKVESNRSQF